MTSTALDIVHEDTDMLVINKPAGLLSQPGRTEPDSVETRAQAHYPLIKGPWLVHRLDMDTSGLLILAKSRQAHKQLQHQFATRQVIKRYRTLLSKPVSGLGGIIRLPIRPDFDNRPYQMICWTHGKDAQTLWRQDRILDNALLLYPLTGRTHQLRVHLAFQEGLGIPILGDRLYGQRGNNTRMMLHADLLKIKHPSSGKILTLSSPATFLPH